MNQFTFRHDVTGPRGECRVYASSIPGFPRVVRVEMFFECPSEMRGSLEVSDPNVNAMARKMTEFVADTIGMTMVDAGREIRDTLMTKYDVWLEVYENDND